jgi:hypothetical protein
MIINVLILIKNKWENWDKDVVSYKKKVVICFGFKLNTLIIDLNE